MSMISFSGFLFRSGTLASFSGYPTGSNNNSFSFVGLWRSFRIWGPAFMGVLVTVTRPAFWEFKIGMYTHKKNKISNQRRDQWESWYIQIMKNIYLNSSNKQPTWHTHTRFIIVMNFPLPIISDAINFLKDQYEVRSRCNIWLWPGGP